ncbi:MAG: DUF3089 domain-containing protein [Lentisphaerae bacterium]|nr:DUF3089 domain-containing protein [Lentisphaerota bacterium]
MRRFLWLMVALLTCRCAGAELPAEVIDYGDALNWVLRPGEDAERRDLDVFYVYPTVVADREHALMSWDSEEIRRKTERIARQQTGMMAEYANVFAPYCRQLEFYRIMEVVQSSEPDVEAMRTGMDDVRAAFRHYLEHWNGGRPFLLLGHSQGAMDLWELMKEDFDDPAVSSNLVAAYLLGMAISPEDFDAHPHLKPAMGEADTGVIVSFNSEAPEAAPSPFSGPGTYGINPLNWRTDGEPASASLHLGAVFFDETGQMTEEIPEFCSTTLDTTRGALIVEPVGGGTYDAPDLFGNGVFHMNDVYFFYHNLGENARVRAAAFLRR